MKHVSGVTIEREPMPPRGSRLITESNVEGGRYRRHRRRGIHGSAMSTPDKPNRAKPINLALQGGGAHGALTWGVLDYLLEDERLTMEGSARRARGR